ncbi:MAG TPA: hypothetical protein VKA19_09400 [Alphaproteobacteria bacterium]|nr:hypothetical protein [Alphaproteobacteria bacterium]
MLKIFSAVAVLGFLIGLAATPVLAESLKPQPSNDTSSKAIIDDAEAAGAALGGAPASTTQDRGTVRAISAPRCANGPRCIIPDPERARRVLGALLASMGTLETKPEHEIGLPTDAR